MELSNKDPDNLEIYHPKVLTRQHKVEQADNSIKVNSSLDRKNFGFVDDKKKNRWLTKLSSSSKPPLTNMRLISIRNSRMASLDSTRSSSSMENDQVIGETGNQSYRYLRQQMPLISITSNDLNVSLDEPQTQQQDSRPQSHTDYYGRPAASSLKRQNRTNSRVNNQNDDYEDDDDDFDDPYQLPVGYSSVSMSRSKIIRQRTIDGSTTFLSLGASNLANDQASLEDLLDDRQGMNNSEQQFTKGEKLPRPSIDGSIISELRYDSSNKKGFKATSAVINSGSGLNVSSTTKSSIRKDLQRRSKSPSSSSVNVSQRRRHSKKGFLGIASRFKLTKKHKSIAKLQLSILNSRFVSLKTLNKDLQSFLPKDRMSTKEFEDRVKLMRRYEVLASIEYRFASRYETYVCRHATQELNLIKNNYKKCIPYDYNRVVLRTLPNTPDSDYINASHVDSCLKPNAYIAAQGPNENTIEDFWRMIWEQKTFVIVMLTKVFDFIRVMCNQYWPVEVNKTERYGNLEVTLLYEEPLADFVIRTIKLTRLRPNTVAQDASSAEQERQTDVGNATETALEDDDDEDDDSADQTDDTSISDELILNTSHWENFESKTNSLMLPVRIPKYISRSRRRDQQSREGISPRPESVPNRFRLNRNSQANGQSLQKPRSSSQPPTEITASPTGPNEDTSQRNGYRKNPPPPLDKLHPLFNAAHPWSGSGSLLGSEPATPVTPRTPSSAGLDRSSATRKAVKKKRRARTKNERPKKTQFMVPDESQLFDDDDDENGLSSPNINESKANERIIYQFHYNSWASHTCPPISSLLHFRRRVRICMDEMSKSGKTGPAVVHCNDGCGRTGTYLCIDANLELVEEDNVIDVYNYTKKMRQSRKFLIENLEQYKFVYDTIEEALFCGKTWFPVSELHKRLKHKSQRNPITKKNEYQREYEKITRMASKFSIGDCAGGHRVENREKNRDVSTVPPDNFRPYLASFQTNDSTDYINAVFVDGYTRSKEYIVTEWPLHKTISDFWSLVYDHDCNSVILLANPGESSTYPSFLPSEKELRRKFGPVFSAEMVSYTHYQNIKSWIYTINRKIVSLTEVIAGVKSETKTTQVFQITCWPQGHRVPTSTNALVELMNMVERWRQRTTYGPVCVVSLNGKSRAGVYCAANVAIEQVVQHSEVDVFQAVKTVRRHRPQLIENMTEYKYCYDLILHYVLHYVNQSAPTT